MKNNNFINSGMIVSETEVMPASRGSWEQAMTELEKSILAALERYSNVHRGSGHFSKVSTHLYEKSRQIVLEYLGLPCSKYEVLFMSPRRAAAFTKQLKPGSFSTIGSKEAGLALGLVAVATERNCLPGGIPFETGGGTTKLYGPDWVIWAGHPDRYEAGTPAIINVIAFARMLQIMKRMGRDVFMQPGKQDLTAREILFPDHWNELQGSELLREMRESMIGTHVRIPTAKGMQDYIHFDNSASTLAFRPAWEVFRQSFRVKKDERASLVQAVRQICSESLGAPLDKYDILFTSNTTESINIAAKGLGQMPDPDSEPVILATLLEHSSNDLPWRMIPGHSLIRLAVDNDGIFDLKALEDILCSYNKEGRHGRKRIRLVAVSGASNVLGTCNDLSAVSRIVHHYGATMVVDAAQLVAHRDIGMETSGIDCLAFSAHKVYAPFGTGVLIFRKGLLQFDDAEWKQIRASGEENTGGIAALGKALQLLRLIGFDLVEEEERKLTRKALAEMSGIKKIKVFGMKDTDQPGRAGKTGVIGFNVDSQMPATVARKLALSGGMGVRFGCLCSHLIIKQLSGFTPFQEKFQRFVVKMVPMLNLQGIIRVSFGLQNTDSDVDALLAELRSLVKDDKNNPAGGQQVKALEQQLDKKAVKRQLHQFIQTAEQLVFG